MKERIILLLLTLLNFTHIMDFMIMMPLGNYLMPYFDITSQQFSWLVAAYTFSAGISGFLAAFFVDRFDRKRVLLFAYAGFLIGTLCCAVSPTYEFLLVSRISPGENVYHVMKCSSQKITYFSHPSFINANVIIQLLLICKRKWTRFKNL